MSSTFRIYLGSSLILLYIVLALGAIGITAYGLYLSFSASVIIGFAALLLEPCPLFIGLVDLFFDVNLAEKLAAALNLAS